MCANKIAGLNIDQTMDGVPHMWLLRFRTQFWYMEGLGARRTFGHQKDDSASVKELIG